jgi:hypothetical protein
MIPSLAELLNMETEPVTNKERLRHESRDANARTLAYFGAGIFVVLALVLIAMKWLFFHFAATQPLGPPPTPFETVRALPPEPRLQVAPAQDWETYWQGQQDILNHYGWVNKQQGVVRLPIDQAMELLLQRGLPVRAQAPPRDSAEVPTESGGPAAAVTDSSDDLNDRSAKGVKR